MSEHIIIGVIKDVMMTFFKNLGPVFRSCNNNWTYIDISKLQHKFRNKH